MHLKTLSFPTTPPPQIFFCSTHVHPNCRDRDITLPQPPQKKKQKPQKRKRKKDNKETKQKFLSAVRQKQQF